MAHYVQYHNSDAMGYSCHQLESLTIMTNKSVRQLPGNTVWLIGGEGKPRRYFLCAVFKVSETGSIDHPKFNYYASGTQGRLFQPALELTSFAWFQSFRAAYQNFSLGLREITDAPYIEELLRIAQS